MGASLEPARALPSDARSAHHTRSARIALYVTLTFGFLVPLLNLPGLSPLLQHSFSISRTLAWGWVGIFDKLFLLFFIPLAVVFWERRPLSSIGVQRPTLTEASLGLPIFLLTEIAALLMSMFLMLLLGLFGVHAMGAEVRRFGASASLLALPIWMGLTGAVLNGIVEELVARGYAIERLESLTGSTLLAATVAWAADLAIHIPFWGPLYALQIAPAQAVFVLAYLWRRNLTACVVGHILNDSIPFLWKAAIPAWMALFGQMSYQTAAGWASFQQHDYNAAISHLTQAITEHPQDARAYETRALAYWQMGRARAAVGDFDQVLRLEPDDAGAHNNLAWLLSTSSDASILDGKRAAGLAQEACELTGWRNAGFIDTLAAAYAQSGDFAKAVETQRRALALVKDNSGMRARLELYLEHQPYRASALPRE